MRLLSITISNFRSYSEPTTVELDDFTAIVGKNDVGKSSIAALIPTESVRLLLRELLSRAGHNKTLVAMANKTARIAWAMLRNEENYKMA